MQFMRYCLSCVPEEFQLGLNQFLAKLVLVVIFLKLEFSVCSLKFFYKPYKQGWHWHDAVVIWKQMTTTTRADMMLTFLIRKVVTFWSVLWSFSTIWVHGSWWSLMQSGLVLKDTKAFNLVMNFGSICYLTNLNLMCCILPVEPFLSL